MSSKGKEIIFERPKSEIFNSPFYLLIRILLGFISQCIIWF